MAKGLLWIPHSVLLHYGLLLNDSVLSRMSRQEPLDRIILQSL